MEFGQLWVAVDLTLRRADEGGRETAITGEPEESYRPNWSMETPDPHAQSGAPVVVINPAPLSPGDRARAVLLPLYPPHWAGVGPGSRLFMYEGARECGQAEVLDVWTTDSADTDGARRRARSWVADD